MLAVLGVPQLLSSYFDHRGRRRDRLDNEASAERRHQESLEQRREERRLEEERRRLEEERRRQEEELRRQEMQLLRQDFETRSSDSERRHQEMMTLLIASINNGSNQGGGQNQTDLLRAMQQTIEELQAENDRLRQQNGHEE
jgi:alpha-galactosidase/6-phospho-beta-glucosidase family protein